MSKVTSGWKYPSHAYAYREALRDYGGAPRFSGFDDNSIREAFRAALSRAGVSPNRKTIADRAYAMLAARAKGGDADG